MSNLQKNALFAPLVVIGLALTASYLMLKGSGFFNTPNYLAVILFGLCILLLNGTRAFYWLCLPLSTLYALYTPIGLTFGAPSYQYVASVFATDLQESKEFFSQIPPLHYLAAIVIFACLWLGHKISRHYRLKFRQNGLFVGLSVVAFFSAIPAFKFIDEGVKSIEQVKTELDRLNNLSIDSEWGTSTLENSHYDDYVLIIGESARKDYHHAYGYPIANTPFMSSANGTLINGFTAGGTNTIASLKLMLTKPDTEKWEGNYGLTLIDLVKSAGVRTYWLSNQGYFGNYATPISSIAAKSDEKFFLKSRESFDADAENPSDFELLPKFNAVLNQPYQGKRFIVLHLYGSHPITCDRLTDYPKLFDDAQIDKKYHNVNCYVSSIKKTDELIAKVYQQLQQHYAATQRPFSLIYFSDHGLAHDMRGESIVIHNSSGKSKLHFDIPLFKISSDDQERREYQVFKSGLNFTDGIARWIGIRNDKLNPNADLFSNQADPNDYGLTQIIEKFEAEPDPAVVIPTP